MNEHFSVGLYALPGLPMLEGGEDVGEMVVEYCRRDAFELREDDVVVVAQKVVSKAERRVYSMAEFEPSAEALELAQKNGKDPRKCEIYLREADGVVGLGRTIADGLMTFMKTKIGFISAGSGADFSNIGPSDEPRCILLPVDPDASARRIRERIAERSGVRVAVIISDSMPRMDRIGSVGTAIGFAGIRHVEQRDGPDLFGHETTTVVTRVDELASAASMLMGEGDEARPVVIVRGADYTVDEDSKIRDVVAALPRWMDTE